MRHTPRPETEASVGIIVLGMHRSGTSATARLLGELGCDFGGELLDGRDDNPDGYYEHRDVVETHNDFLRQVGRSWQDARPWRDELASEAAASARRRIEELFDRDFAPRPLWVLKDPRLCRLLPLWRGVLEQADVRFAVIHRHPWAIARSLARRDTMHPSQSMLLWLRHVLEAERETRGRRRCHVGFEQLLARPGEMLRRLLEGLGLSTLAQQAQAAAERVIDAERVHHRAQEDGSLDAEYPWVERAYRAVEELATDDSAPQGEARLDEVRDHLAIADRLFDQGLAAPMAAILDERDRDRTALREASLERERYVASLLETLDRRSADFAEQDRYVESLTAALAEKDRYATYLERMFAETRSETERYVASLLEALAAGDRLAQAQADRIRALEARLAP